MMTFGQMVKAARLGKGWTLVRTAKAIRSHKGYVSGIENGKVNAPSQTVVARLCRAFHLQLGPALALAWWEKRPKLLTITAAHELLSTLREEEAKAKSDESHVVPPAPEAQTEKATA